MISAYSNILKVSGSTERHFLILKRFKQKKIHWAKLEKKNFPKDIALRHFDDFYQSIFRSRWRSVRLALLSPHKYVALVNNFGDVAETEEKLLSGGAVNLKKLFELTEEKLKSNAKEEQKNKEYKKIFDLDEKLKVRAQMKEREELGQIYSPNASIEHLLKKESKEDDRPELSMAVPLYETLSDAELDSGRLIEPGNIIDATALFDYVPATKLKGLEDYVSESQHYDYYKVDSTFPLKIKQQTNFEFPEHLKVYAYNRGNVSTYPYPRRGKLNVANYYLLDGSSILPVIALDLKPGDYVLDMCAAPGGKTLTILQTLYPKLLVSNDSSIKRYKRMYHMLEEYLPDFESWKDKLMLLAKDGHQFNDEDFYDKILVDVPCTTDRLSVMEDDNNIFTANRTKERLKLPELQSGLLVKALKLVRRGGTVVYSTCSLSPIQNDGVVNMSLKTCWEETKREFKIIDMTRALNCTSDFFRFGTNIGLKFGHLVIPFLPCNFGPLYFCKMVRIK